MGYVYLIHLEKPLHGDKRHYVGYTDNLERRIQQHRAGEGARFLKQANDAGINWLVVRAWIDVGRDKEASIKKMSARIICPVCKAKGAELARHRKMQQVSMSEHLGSTVADAA